MHLVAFYELVLRLLASFMRSKTAQSFEVTLLRDLELFPTRPGN